MKWSDSLALGYAPCKNLLSRSHPKGVNALFGHCTGSKLSIGLPSQKSFQSTNCIIQNFQIGYSVNLCQKFNRSSPLPSSFPSHSCSTSAPPVWRDFFHPTSPSYLHPFISSYQKPPQALTQSPLSHHNHLPLLWQSGGFATVSTPTDFFFLQPYVTGNKAVANTNTTQRRIFRPLIYSTPASPVLNPDHQQCPTFLAPYILLFTVLRSHSSRFPLQPHVFHLRQTHYHHFHQFRPPRTQPQHYSPIILHLL